MSEVNTRVLGMLRGDFHGTGGYLPQDQVKRLHESDETVVLEEESMRIFLFQINNQRAPMSDRTCAAPSTTRSTTTGSSPTS